MPKRSVITIHWDEQVDKKVALPIADHLAEVVMDRIHDDGDGDLLLDTDVSATLWEDDD